MSLTVRAAKIPPRRQRSGRKWEEIYHDRQDNFIKYTTRRRGVAVEQALSPEVEQAVRRIVEEKIAAYGPELDRKIDLAVQRRAAAGDAERPRRAEMRSCVEKAVAGALSGMPHLISAGYVPLGDDYWPLFVIHDSDDHGDLTSDLVDKISELQKLPSVPTLDLKLAHVSRNTPMPSEATVIFAKK